MDESKIPVRYAKALLGLAREKQLLDTIKDDLEIISQLFETTPKFAQLLESPVVGTNEKRKLFENVFAGRVNALTYSFLELLVTNNREAYLKGTARNFLESYRKASGYKIAKMVSAIEIDTATIEEFRELVRRHFSTEVDLTCEVDTGLIGGFVLQVEDQQIDASVATKLKRLKRELLESQK